MSKNFKEKYSFIKYKITNVKETTKKVEDGKEIEITQTVEKKTPFRVIIKNPSRSERENMDVFYAVAFNDFIKRGLLTSEMMSKKYDDFGGILSEEDKKECVRKWADLYEAQNELIRIEATKEDLSEKQKSKKESIIQKIAELKESVFYFQNKQENVFNLTANYMARNKTIQWCIVNLTYIKDEEDDSEPKPYFDGTTFDEKMDSLEEKDDSGDSLFKEIYLEISLFVQFWYLGIINDTESFLKMKKDMETDSNKE